MRESPPAGSGGMMNGAVYISFFQGQLESVLERVVQLAVQEISKTVGSSLNALLLEAAAKEQENRPLRLQLQARESRGRAGSRPAEGEGSASDRKAGEEPAAPEQRLPRPQQHAPGGQDPQPRGPTDTRRLQQRGRIVAGSSGRRSSASMLHRLLTLPSQLMDEEHEAAVAGETQAAPAGHHNNQGPSSPAAWVKEEEEEEEEEDGRDKGRKKRRRLWSECGDCGQRFSRRSLLKAHRQSHATQNAPAGASGSPPPHDGPAAAPRCPPCGKRAACRATTGSSSGWTCRIRPDQNQNP